MKTLALKIPPALLMLIFGLKMWLIDYLLPTFKLTWPWHEWVAKGIFLVALMCIILGVISFKIAHTTVDPTHPEKASTVVTSGIYKITRNPMYLGFLLMLGAFVVKLENPTVAVMLPLFVWYMNRFQIKPEENALEKLFGSEYDQYREKVRRWI